MGMLTDHTLYWNSRTGCSNKQQYFEVFQPKKKKKEEEFS